MRFPPIVKVMHEMMKAGGHLRNACTRSVPVGVGLAFLDESFVVVLVRFPSRASLRALTKPSDSGVTSCG